MANRKQPVIVVEDDASMSEAIERILRAGGRTPELFSSAEALLEADAAADAVCLIVDVRLPAMSGIELVRTLNDRGIRCPVIVITAHDEQSVHNEVRELGVHTFLPKPFHGRELLDAVNRSVQLCSNTENSIEP